jgi:hypothetical protein
MASLVETNQIVGPLRDFRKFDVRPVVEPWGSIELIVDIGDIQFGPKAVEPLGSPAKSKNVLN